MIEFYEAEREKGILKHKIREERKMEKLHYITMRCSAILFFVLSILRNGIRLILSAAETL